jgi:phage tail sheath protein FI
MSEKYGIQSRLIESAAETPVSTSTELVFIGSASCKDSSGSTKSSAPYLKAVRISSLEDYKTTFGSDLTLVQSLSHAAIAAFTYNRLDHAWFINVNDPSSVKTSVRAVTYDELAEGIDTLDAVFMGGGAIPNVVCLPLTNLYASGTTHHDGSGIAEYAAQKSQSIAGHYKAQVVVSSNQDGTAQISPSTNRLVLDEIGAPTQDEGVLSVLGGGVVGSSLSQYVGWIDGAAYVAARRVAEDAVNTGGLPYRSVGNLQCSQFKGVCLYSPDMSNIVLDKYTTNESDATAVQELGVVTFLNQGANSYYTWGDHTNAVSAAKFDERGRFDSSIAMLYHISNRFIQKWKSEIDSPMTLSLRNDIIAEENSYLSYLVAAGALIGDPICEFRPVDNTSDTLAQGQFYFTNIMTTTIPAKYLELKLQYTDAGLSVYTE